MRHLHEICICHRDPMLERLPLQVRHGRVVEARVREIAQQVSDAASTCGRYMCADEIHGLAEPCPPHVAALATGSVPQECLGLAVAKSSMPNSPSKPRVSCCAPSSIGLCTVPRAYHRRPSALGKCTAARSQCTAAAELANPANLTPAVIDTSVPAARPLEGLELSTFRLAPGVLAKSWYAGSMDFSGHSLALERGLR